MTRNLRFLKRSVGQFNGWFFLPVPIEKTYNALDTDIGRASFWTESAILPDGKIEFQFINGSYHQSKILEQNTSYLWVIEGVARFELTEKDDGTELLLIHSSVSTDEWIETYTGWLTVLLPLKA